MIFDVLKVVVQVALAMALVFKVVVAPVEVELVDIVVAMVETVGFLCFLLFLKSKIWLFS